MRFVLPCFGLLTALPACNDSSAGPLSVIDARADSDARLESIGSFTLIGSDGREVTERSLRGEPWIASFIFTTCRGPCPQITANLASVQGRLAGSSVKLVSFSVDPGHDTPEVLATHARAQGADSARWFFLTGDETQIFELLRQSFLQGVQREKDAPQGFQVTHSTRVVVLDAEGRVAGIYPGESPEGVGRAVERALWLDAH